MGAAVPYCAIAAWALANCSPARRLPAFGAQIGTIMG